MGFGSGDLPLSAGAESSQCLQLWQIGLEREGGRLRRELPLVSLELAQGRSYEVEI
jgi:hypothetical protein